MKKNLYIRDLGTARRSFRHAQEINIGQAVDPEK